MSRPPVRGAVAGLVAVCLVVHFAPVTRSASSSQPPPGPSAVRLFLPAVTRSEPRPIEPLGQVGGTLGAVAMVGHMAFLEAGPRLASLDLTDPRDPVVLGRSEPFTGTLHHMVAADDHVFAAHQARSWPSLGDMDPMGGLLVFDVGDPSRPHQCGHLPTPGSAWRVHAASGRVFIADGEAGVRIADVSVPCHPVEIASFDTPGEAVDVVSHGSTLFVAVRDGPGSGAEKRHGIMVVDVRDPRHPSTASFLDLESPPAALFVRGKHLVVVLAVYGVLVLDADDPALRQVAEVQEVFYWGIYDASLAPDGILSVLFMPSRNPDPDAQYGSVKLFDLRDPPHPALAGRFDVPGYYRALGVDNGLVVLPNSDDNRHRGGPSDVPGVKGGGGRVHVLDIVDPSAPKLQASARVQGLLDICRVAPHGFEVFTRNEGGDVAIVDVRWATSPFVLGMLEQGSRYTTPCPRIVVSGGFAFTGGEAGLGLTVVDGRDQAKPEILTHPLYEALLGEDALIRDLALDGPLLLVAHRSWSGIGAPAGIRFLDVGDPEQPIDLGHYPGDFTAIAMRDSIVFASSGRPFGRGTEAVLNVLDAHAPAHVDQLAQLALPEARTYIDRLVLFGDLVAASNRAGGQVLLIDVSVAEEPRLVGQLDQGTDSETSLGVESSLWVHDVLGVGGRLLMADGRGLHMLDISTPADPRRVASYPLPGGFKCLTMSGGVVAAGAEEAGLWLFDPLTLGVGR